MTFATYADLETYVAGTPKTGKHLVSADETQMNKPTEYIWNGTELKLIEGITTVTISQW